MPVKIFNVLSIYLRNADEEEASEDETCLFLGLKRANGRKNVTEQSLVGGGRNVRMRISRGKSPADSSIG